MITILCLYSPDDQGLHSPSPVVTKCKPVQMRVESVPGDVPAVHPVLLLTVNGVVGHAGVNPDNDGPDCGPVLVEQELEQQQVEDGDTQDTAPESRVGPSEGTVGQGEDGEDHEEDEDPHQASEDVVVPVRVIPGEGCPGQRQHTNKQQTNGVRLVKEL